MLVIMQLRNYMQTNRGTFVALESGGYGTRTLESGGTRTTYLVPPKIAPVILWQVFCLPFTQ